MGRDVTRSPESDLGLPRSLGRSRCADPAQRRCPKSRIPQFPAQRSGSVPLETLSSPFAKHTPRGFQGVQQAFKIQEHMRPCSFQKA